MSLCYPLSVDDQRTLPEGYDGHAFVWDIDKTYLSTGFSTFRGLSRIPLEFAVDKLAIPGMPEILRGLRRGPGPGFACAPIYFVSGSPPQLRRVIEHKMLLDGVEYDGITCKDWVAALRQRRPGRLREQVGFKVCALLEGRQRRPHAEEYLFGDDAEQDAVAFHLYAQLINADLSPGEALARMVTEGVARDDRRCVFDLLARLPGKRGRVKRIFIHLEKKTPPEHFEPVGDLVVPVHGSCQLGLALFELGLIDRRAVREACGTLASGSAPAEASLETRVADALARGLVSAERLQQLDL